MSKYFLLGLVYFLLGLVYVWHVFGTCGGTCFVTCGGAGGGTWITPGSVVPVLSGWTTLEFGIEAGDLIAPVDAVATDAAATLADVGRLRILHAAGDTFRGDSIMGQLDIDNIEAVPEPSAALAAFASLATLCALRVVRLARGTRRCS